MKRHIRVLALAVWLVSKLRSEYLKKTLFAETK